MRLVFVPAFILFGGPVPKTKRRFVLLVKGRTGKDLLLLNGYTYYQHKLLRDGFRWSCTQMGSRSCRGFLHVTKEMMVIRAHTEHTHPPSTTFLKKLQAEFAREIKAIEFYLRPNGRVNLRLNNFTFYKHLKARTNAHRWSCTAYGSKWKCKAHLIITDKLEVVKANVAHSHPPSVKHELKKTQQKSIKMIPNPSPSVRKDANVDKINHEPFKPIPIRDETEQYNGIGTTDVTSIVDLNPLQEYLVERASETYRVY